jgi:hypothetical protein
MERWMTAAPAIGLVRARETFYEPSAIQRLSGKCMSRGTLRLDLLRWAILIIVIVALLPAPCGAQVGRYNADLSGCFTRGIRVHCGTQTFDVNCISTSSDTSSITFAGDRLEKGTVVCAVGSGIDGKGLTMSSSGGDPGDCVLFIDTATRRVERTSYHTPQPDFLSPSPNGMYVGMASRSGWLKPENGVQIKKNHQNRNRGGMLPAEATHELNSLLLGTLRYSVWKVPEGIPLWEMRFYGESAADGAAARFERPWNNYAKLALPWWAMEHFPSMFRPCRIDFSPDSLFFVALDPRHGVHVLRLDNGTQFHCCLATVDKYPLFFYFPDEPDQLNVVFGDLSIRRVNLKTGQENTDGRLSLPVGATAEPPIASNFFELTNFAVDSRSGVLAFEQNSSLQLRNITPTAGHHDRREIHQIGALALFTRLSLSADKRTVGIGYGYVKYEFGPVDHGRISMYEAADVKTGLIKRRLLTTGSSIEKSPSDGAVLTLTSGEISACLSPDGSDIIYAEPLKQP